ncbi:MAG: TIR domain-containing protein [Steroidobacteraceae bacterium]
MSLTRVAAAGSSGIFISYRRSDNPDATGRIYDRLVAEFGKTRVFKDVDSIPLGTDFRGHLNQIVGGCAVVLAIIGPSWADTRSNAGQRRLEDPDDFVRIELEAALARGIPVVPVLVGNATMPGVTQLPTSLAELAYRQSIQVRPDPDFHNDATRLVSALQVILDPDAPPRPIPSRTEASAGGSSKWMIACAAAMLAAAALAFPALKHLQEVPLPETRVDIVTPNTDDLASFAISPDGRQIVFTATVDGATRLWLRSLASATAAPLAGTDGATLPFWSPDSRSIGFFAVGSLKRLNLGGGQPQTLAPITMANGGTWSTQGDILFPATAGGPLSRIAASGGATTALQLLGKNERGNAAPLFLPDGQHFVFNGRNTRDARLYLGSLDGKTAVELSDDVKIGTLPAYLPSGWLLWIRAGGTLTAQRLDVAKAALVGEVVSLAEGASGVSASATGVVAYRTGDDRQRQLVWLDRSGNLSGTVGPPDGSLKSPRVSPDGRQVAFARQAEGKSDIWLQGETRASRMTFESESSDIPVWSSDGTRLAFQSQRGAVTDLFQKPTDGAHPRESLLVNNQAKWPSSWSRDGRYLLYFSINPGSGIDLWVLPMTGQRKPFPLLQSTFGKVWGQFSPDGRWVAYQSNESGQNEIYVRRFVVPTDAADSNAAGESQWQVSTAGGIYPTWRADGKELFYIDPSGRMMAAPIATSGPTVVPGTPVALFQTNTAGGGSDNGTMGRQYDVAPDGRFLINRVLDTASSPIRLILNWNPEGKQ